TTITSENANNNGQKGKNATAVTFSVHVTGVQSNQAIANGTLQYLTVTGTTTANASINLVQDANDPTLFSVTFAVDSVKFSQGSSQPFIFTVTQGSQTVQQTLNVKVS